MKVGTLSVTVLGTMLDTIDTITYKDKDADVALFSRSADDGTSVVITLPAKLTADPIVLTLEVHL